MSTQKDNVAKYYPGDNQHVIYLDETVYDLCSTIGSDSLDALACIIGHELGHYYEEHLKSFGFNAKEIKDVPSKKKVDIEKKADKFGLFYGAVAGYNTPLNFPIILRLIYKEYNRTETIKGYPSLEERESIINDAIKETDELINVYRTAQNLYAINHFESAYNCMNYLMNYYPSKLIHNNLGICQLSLYLDKITDASIYPYIYPFEFDVRIKRIEEVNKLTSRSQDFTMIDEAITHFKQAILIDPYYEVAYINLACAYSIRGNQDAASGTINELEQFLNNEGKQLTENAYLIRGISKALNGNTTVAAENFENISDNSDINILNKRILEAEINHESTYFDDFKRWVNSYFDEEIESNLTEISINKDLEVIKNQLPINLSLTNEFKEIDLGNWSTLYYLESKDFVQIIYQGHSEEVKMIIAFDNYKNSTEKGIKVNSTFAEVTDANHYGYPSFRWNNSPQAIITYQHGNIGFILENDHVVNWFTWYVGR
ncbi:M48 family metalloprotease [Flammeovirga kamogawensis]|uniref:Tetratricopeptide repeat protein n=1 Tax=Flammeovirga kamogawensis TaxID=373891 RepID=A0ABX8GZB7_9BACT|nr:hypothetical protein [Flammeovirga kamogawensis]MBB6459394.1 tetratricopeptide (TPR) repeat protein [Flammeovirga kamogawensis]QWG08950.1 hypothetical protein KM029_08395 [Flammeovirga kamogawensis]TRX67240.1 hypothetical protein EO216_03440 [Flammeovirga kamogawensis]